MKNNIQLINKDKLPDVRLNLIILSVIVLIAVIGLVIAAESNW